MRDGDRWERLKDLFAEAVERDAPGREELIARTRRDDPTLADELAELLASHDRTDAFMGAPTLPPEAWESADDTALRPGGAPLPETFGRYRIVSLLGQGGMGQVFLAHEPALERDVALKVLPALFASRPKHREAFLREARAAASLNHPNITTIHEIGNVDGRDYISFEYVRGQTLKERIAQGALPLADLLALAQPLADALGYAHERGVVHRDVKTGNVMVTDRGLPKLLDFGLATSLSSARAAGDDAAAAGWPGVSGTPSAMSPEQARGEALDHRTDVFSFGSLLYEMAAGRPAFEAEDLEGTLEAVMHQEPAELSELRPDLPKAFVAIVERCLRKDPAERYQRMTEVADELRSLAVATDRAQTRRLTRVAVWGLAVLALVLAAVVPLLMWSHTAPNQPVVAVMGFEDPGDPGDHSQVGAMLSRLVTSHLSAGGGLQVVSDQLLFDAAKRLGHEDGRIEPSMTQAVAVEVGADTIVSGRSEAAGDEIVAGAEIVDVETGRTLASFEVRGAGQAAVFTMADSLAHQIRAALNEPAMTDDVRKALADQLTTSVDAFRAYVRGLEGLLRNDLPEALAALREATAIDPAFALAQYRLWMALIWTGEFEESSRALQRTIAFRDKLPRDLQLVLDAMAPYGVGEDHRTELPRLQQVLEQNPDSADVLYLIGEIYTHSATHSDSERAATTYERLLALDPGLSLVYDHRLQALLRLGRWEEARAQLEHWALLAPTNLAALQGTLALWEGRLDEAGRLLADPLIADFLAADDERPSVQSLLSRSVAELVSGLEDVHGAYLVLELDLRADILVVHGRFDDAAELYGQANEVLSTLVSRDGFHISLRNGARHRLASLMALRGDMQGARQQTRAALESQPESYRCVFVDALMALRDGDLAAARTQLSTLSDLVGNGWSPASALYRDALAAELALAEDRVVEARTGFATLVDSGRLMEDWYVHEDSIGPWVRDGLARALLAEGDTAGAEAAWASLTNCGFERLRQPIPWVLSLFHRGQLALQAGRVAEGRALLEDFLERWGSAFPDLPQVVEARALLAD